MYSGVCPGSSAGVSALPVARWEPRRRGAISLPMYIEWYAASAQGDLEAVEAAHREMWAALEALERQVEDRWVGHLCCHGAAKRLRHSLELDILRRMLEHFARMSAITSEEADRAAIAAFEAAEAMASGGRIGRRRAGRLRPRNLGLPPRRGNPAASVGATHRGAWPGARGGRARWRARRPLRGVQTEGDGSTIRALLHNSVGSTWAWRPCGRAGHGHDRWVHGPLAPPRRPRGRGTCGLSCTSSAVGCPSWKWPAGCGCKTVWPVARPTRSRTCSMCASSRTSGCALRAHDLPASRTRPNVPEHHDWPGRHRLV